MDIEIKRGKTIQKGRPASVTILLIGNDRNTKAAITVWPTMVKAKDFDKDDTFHVEIFKGHNALSSDLDIKVDI